MEQDTLSRRTFLDKAARWGLLAGAAGVLAPPSDLLRLLGLDPNDPRASESLETILRRAPAARYWLSVSSPGVACSECHGASGAPEGKPPKHHSRTVKCFLCAHGCVIPDGKRGRCRTRLNVEGKLVSLVYGRPIAQHVDPIEKKPLYHFLPTSQAYSLATSGCPLHCKFCQNWEISQAKPEDYSVRYCPAEAMARRAKGRRVPVIAFTYNEPTVFTEYLLDVARAGKALGLRSVLVSCGFMTEAPLQDMIGALDAIKIDLKGFSSAFYREVSHAELTPVLRSIKQVAESGRHLELVNLVVPTLNDSPRMLTDLAKWVAGELGPDVPVHFTRFHPDYQLLNLPPTPVATLEKAREIAMKQGIRYAYVGNVPGNPGNSTYCPSCGKVVIERWGFFVKAMHMKKGKCAFCGTPIAGVWK